MGYQFAHLSTFSRKGNTLAGTGVAGICGEAARLDGHAPHVENPQPPNILYGMNPADIPAELDRAINARKKDLNGKGTKTTRIRKDTHCLEGIVMSWPGYTRQGPDGQPGLESTPERERYEAWRSDTIAWAMQNAMQRGLRVMSIVEHLDEAHPHIHVLSIPSDDPRMDAKQSHPGYAAKFKAEQSGATAKEVNKAYKDAMRDWQTQYETDISVLHGLNRLGPQKRRLTRAAWKAEQEEAKRIAERLKIAEATELEAQRRLAIANRDITLAKKEKAEATANKAATALALQAANNKFHEQAAKMAGVEAWCNGHLVGPGPDEPDGQKTLILAVEDAERGPLIERLTPAWEWLHEWTTQQNARIKQIIEERAAKAIPPAIAEAVKKAMQNIEHAARLAMDLAPYADKAIKAKAAELQAALVRAKKKDIIR